MTTTALPFGLTVDKITSLNQHDLRKTLRNLQTEGRCREHDPEVFFPISSSSEEAAKAVGICRTCSVRRDCLVFALATNTQDGVFGGYTSEQRRPWLLALHGRWSTYHNPVRT